MIRFNYKVFVEFEVTKDELEVLLVLSAHHYDGHCRSVSQSGFLNGMKNVQMFDEHPTHSLRFRDIDTLCKILEMSDTLSPIGSLLHMNKPQLVKVASQLAIRLHGYLRAINAESERLEKAEDARRKAPSGDPA